MRTFDRICDDLFDDRGSLGLTERLVGLSDLRIWEPEDFEDVEDIEIALAAHGIRAFTRRSGGAG